MALKPSEPRKRLSWGQRLKVATIGCGLGISLLMADLAAFSYVPPVPRHWVPELRRQADLMVRVFKPHLEGHALTDAVEESVKNARLFTPPGNFLVRLSGHDPYSVSGFGGSPYFPHFLIPGAMVLKNVKSYNHEWLHFYAETSRNHYSLSDALSRYADRWGNWGRGRHYQGPVFKGDQLHYSPRKGSQSDVSPARFNVAEIESRFRREDSEGHNAYGTPAKDLGDLAKLEESRLKMPAFGFFLMREVANGMPVRRALSYVAKSPTIQRERKALLKAHPDLNWLVK